MSLRIPIYRDEAIQGFKKDCFVISFLAMTDSKSFKTILIIKCNQIFEKMRSRIFYLITIIFILFVSEQSPAGMFQSGERLHYKVSYFGITLGHITINIEGTEDLKGIKVVKTKGYMQSNPDIPFVNLQASYQSWIDTSGAFSHQFIGQVMIEDGSWDYHQIDFDYKKKKIRTQKWIHKEVFFDSTYHTSKKYCDGLSLFFLARQFTKIGKRIRIPTIVDYDTVFTIINFMNKKSESEIKAVKHKIRTVYFNGKAFWTGIYGLTGEFEGWFSDDDASIPIRAKMKVYVGNIDIELIEWDRNNWSPPKAN